MGGHMALIGEERNIYWVLVGKPEKRDHSEDRGVDGRTVSECIVRRLPRMEWFKLAQDGDRWRALVTTVMNLERQAS
jgi:hypothetical protein